MSLPQRGVRGASVASLVFRRHWLDDQSASPLQPEVRQLREVEMTSVTRPDDECNRRIGVYLALDAAAHVDGKVKSGWHAHDCWQI